MVFAYLLDGFLSAAEYFRMIRSTVLIP